MITRPNTSMLLLALVAVIGLVFVSCAAVPIPPESLKTSKNVYLIDRVEGTTTAYLIKEFHDAPDNSTVNFYISSPGGLVLDEYTIKSAMKQFKARGGIIKAHIMLEASSAAAMISCEANTVTMEKKSFRMFHTLATYRTKVLKTTPKDAPLAMLWDWQHEDFVACGLSKTQIDLIEAGHDIYIKSDGTYFTVKP